ncbi:MAG: hypothetical protein ABIV50_13595 [Opitutus sp.]
MKTNIASLLLLAAVISVTAFCPLSAASNGLPAIAYPVTSVTVADRFRPTIERGTDRATVVEVMGQPSARLTPDVWLYHNYRTNDLSQANDLGCRSMIVTFANEKVSKMNLVNQRAAYLISKNAKQKSTELFALKK